MRVIETYFLVFAIASVLGWCMESSTSILYPENKKLVNRGFLIGPYLPVYGLGVAGISFLFQRFSDNIPLVFLLSMILCSLIEYITSYILEKIFHARWWDYSNQKFNINGRIYVVNMILFGIAGVVIVELVDPFLLGLLDKIPDLYMHIASGVFLGIILIDTIVSSIIAFGLKKASTEVTDEIKDNTLDVNEERKELSEQIAKKVGTNVNQTAKKIGKTAKEATIKTKKTIVNTAVKTKKTIADNTAKTKKTIASTASKTKKTIASTATKIKSFKPLSFEEMQTKIKERFASQNKWSDRLTRAFPNMKISLPNAKKHDDENVDLKEETDNKE